MRYKRQLFNLTSQIRRLAFQIWLLAALPMLAWSQIALVHVTSCGKQAFPSACTIPSSASGNLIVVGFQIGGAPNTAATISSITDNAGNTYAEAGNARAIDTTIGTVIDLWYAKNSVAGTTSVTISPTANVNGGAVIWEFSGADLTSPLDQTAVLNNQASTASVSGATVTITSPNEVVIAITEVAHAVTGISSGNAFVNDATVMSNGWAHLFTSSTGTYSAQWTQTPVGTFASSTASFKAASSGTSPLSACDLVTPYGAVDSSDVQMAINMSLGVSPCNANIAGAGVCNVVTVQRVINATQPGGTCLTGTGTTSHSVTLNWVASTTTGVTYNIYRSSTSGVYSTPLASSGATTSYTDTTVQSGQTYFYVITALSGSSESTRSNETQAVIP